MSTKQHAIERVLKSARELLGDEVDVEGCECPFCQDQITISREDVRGDQVYCPSCNARIVFDAEWEDELGDTCPFCNEPCGETCEEWTSYDDPGDEDEDADG